MISRIDIEDMTDAQDEALLPCPFCGKSPKTFGPYGWHRQWGISHNCRAFYNGGSEAFQGYPTKRAAIEAWNTRADLARPSQAGDERVEALVAFARPFADALEIECDFMTPPAPFEDGFDVQRRARAALAAMDTPKGGGDE